MRVHYTEQEARDAHLADQRAPGESFCADCPDHEACMISVSCYTVRLVDYLHAEAEAKRKTYP